MDAGGRGGVEGSWLSTSPMGPLLARSGVVVVAHLAVVLSRCGRSGELPGSEDRPGAGAVPGVGAPAAGLRQTAGRFSAGGDVAVPGGGVPCPSPAVRRGGPPPGPRDRRGRCRPLVRRRRRAGR